MCIEIMRCILNKSVLSFHHVGYRDQNDFLGLRVKGLCMWKNLLVWIIFYTLVNCLENNFYINISKYLHFLRIYKNNICQFWSFGVCSFHYPPQILKNENEEVKSCVISKMLSHGESKIQYKLKHIFNLLKHKFRILQQQKFQILNFTRNLIILTNSRIANTKQSTHYSSKMVLLKRLLMATFMSLFLKLQIKGFII